MFGKGFALRTRLRVSVDLPSTFWPGSGMFVGFLKFSGLIVRVLVILFVMGVLWGFTLRV